MTTKDGFTIEGWILPNAFLFDNTWDIPISRTKYSEEVPLIKLILDKFKIPYVEEDKKEYIIKNVNIVYCITKHKYNKDKVNTYFFREGNLKMVISLEHGSPLHWISWMPVLIVTILIDKYDLGHELIRNKGKYLYMNIYYDKKE